MSRSLVVMVVAGAILLGVLAFVFQHYWPVLALESTLMKAILIGLGVYGALLAAVMIRRIADPTLPMPILAWVVAGAWFIFGLIAHAHHHSKDENRDHHHHHDTDPAKSSSFGKAGTGMAWAIFLTLVGLAMYAAGVGITHYIAKHRLEAPLAAPSTTKPAIETPAADQRATIPVPSDVTDVSDLPSAITYASKRMTADAEPSEGAKQLARWMAKRGKWGDVSVAKNETSVDLVEKDAARQRGLRLCIAGTLERIEKQTFEGTEVHSARLITAQKDAVELYAVGKTGALVKRKPAKFCGVVTGGMREGRVTVTFAVGMFDTNK